jgi:uncharacterized protein
MKQLPEKIALDKAVHGKRYYQGKVKLQEMSRLIDVLDDANGEVEFSIQFDRAAKLLGQARLQISTDLALICTISAKSFLFHVEIDSTVGFIDDVAYEDCIGENMEASWVENGFVKPLEIIEDELILAVPDTPFDETCGQVESEVVEVVEQKPNPFDVLKSLKK